MVASQASAATPRVLIVDNDGRTANAGIDHVTGDWGFAPSRLAVVQGESIVFDNPAGNFRSHDVVSISRSGSSTEPVLESGTKFSSGTARESFLMPGSSWTLDTSTLDPGYYAYYCTIHPWMVASLTVLPPAQPAGQ